MNVVLPLTLDAPTDLHRPDGTVSTVTEITAADVASGFQVPHPQGVSGYDASDANNGRGVRITNIVKATGATLVKHCPNCEGDKPFAGFGESRTTNELRDQSNCTECRGEAFQS